MAESVKRQLIDTTDAFTLWADDDKNNPAGGGYGTRLIIKDTRGRVTGIRWQRGEQPFWDLDILANNGDLIFDNLFVIPSTNIITIKQSSYLGGPALFIDESRISVSRVLQLLDAGTGNIKLGMQGSDANGIRWFDNSQSGPPSILQILLGANGQFKFSPGGIAEALRIDSAIANGETSLLLLRNVGGSFTLQRVSMGVADSGGAGFKVLRVPN